MSSEIKDYVSNCSVCNTIQPSQARESLIVHEIPTPPWSKVVTDLSVYNTDNFVVIVYYYSNFIEVERTKNTSSQSIIQVLKTIFGRHGIPDTVVSDNGPAYASEEFKKFADDWEFSHVTNSPHYPRSNGKAESAVKTCKMLMKKATLANSDLHLALLNHRNTPTEPTNLSPAQRLFGRRTRTQLLPTTTLLMPQTPLQVPAELKKGQHKQSCCYDRKSKSLTHLNPGDVVCLKLPGSTSWTPGICKHQVAP